MKIFFAPCAANLGFRVEIRSTFAAGLEQHHKYMDSCVQLAKLAQGLVAPNPMVGCVVLLDNKIIAEGFHKEFGQAHAEIDALSKIDESIDLSNAILYVNLEPCNHWGKTGPCSNTIVQRGIKKVVVGMLDPFEKVNGAGIDFLKNKGVEVVVLNHKPSIELNRRFVWHIQKKIPYIILKWAESADGFMGNIGERTQISGMDAKILLHRWRSYESAIAVGKNTFVIDNPQLTVRLNTGKSPKRLVWWGKKTSAPLISGFEFITSEALEPNLRKLAANGIQSILIEGGPTLLQSFIDAKMYNEIRVIRSKGVHLGQGINVPTVDLVFNKTLDLKDDEVWEALI